ncbi:MATE family efflux transporter [Mangrovivirga cuniculi]|uniref:Membrane protein involved in the export of O-antigen and teichoic acid n=1 Tax=Mangrovivirga cuniculi TaxID=2715131 RepID=A0A4D7JU10_9BACT|nr:hypothetical protein [Mangrovivirga cuniculi]QCK14375.1 hypothetical protein DCC35_06275 [Mangrovivirga cuniculi]
MKKLLPFFTQLLKGLFQVGINKLFSVLGGGIALLSLSHLLNFFQLCLAPVNTFYSQSLHHYLGGGGERSKPFSGYLIIIATLTSYFLAFIALIFSPVLFKGFELDLWVLILLSIGILPFYVVLTVVETQLIFNSRFDIQFKGYLLNVIITGAIVSIIAWMDWYYGIISLIILRVLVILIAFVKQRKNISFKFRKYFRSFYEITRPYIGISVLAVILTQFIFLAERNLVKGFADLSAAGAWQAASTTGFYIQLIAITIYSSFYIPEISKRKGALLLQYVWRYFLILSMFFPAGAMIIVFFSEYLHMMLFSSKIIYRAELYYFIISGFVLRSMAQLFSLLFLKEKLWRDYLAILLLITSIHISGLIYLYNSVFTVNNIAILFLIVCTVQFIMSLGFYIFRRQTFRNG